MAIAQELVTECVAPTKRVQVHTFPVRRRAPRSASEDTRAPLPRAPRSTSDGDKTALQHAMTPITSDDEALSECATPTQRVRIHTFPARRRVLRPKGDAASAPSPTSTAASLFSAQPAPRAKVVLYKDNNTVDNSSNNDSDADSVSRSARKRASASFYNKMCPTKERGAVTLIDESRLAFLKASPRGQRNKTLLEFLQQHATARSKSNRVRADVTWQKLLEAAISLKELHEQGIVHGNLQCRNILITADAAQRARVRNFAAGAQTERSSKWRSGGHRDSSNDANAANVASEAEDDDDAVRWLAPECLEEGLTSITSASSTEADVFAFGMCILEAVTRTEPWGAVSSSVVRVLQAAGRLPTRAAGYFRDAEWHLIERMCAKDPSQRVDMAFVVAHLRVFADREQARRAARQREAPRVLYSETIDLLA